MKVCVLHDIDAYFTMSFFHKILSKDFFFLSKIRNCKIPKNPLNKFFIFSN